MNRKIYIINQLGTDLYKIGFTRKKVSERIKQLQTGSSNELIEVFEFNSKYATKVESTVHRFLKLDHIKGEWFQLDKSKLNTITELIITTDKNFQYLEDNKI